MKRYLVLQICCFLSTYLSASDLIISEPIPETMVQIGCGYRVDHTRWDMRAPKKLFGAKTTSKLSFKDEQIFIISGEIKSIVTPWLYTRGYADFGWMTGKTLHETDKFKSLSPPVTMESRFFLDAKNVYDVSLGVGYPFDFFCSQLIIAPLIGYSYQAQNYGITELPEDLISQRFTAAQQTALGILPLVQPTTPATLTFSRYRSREWGPWVGVDIYYRPYKCITIYGEFDYHFAQLRRKRKSNTGITYFDTFKKTTFAHGYNSTFGINYTFAYDWYVGGSFNLQYWSSKSRYDSFLLQLYSFNLNVGYKF